MLSQGFAVLLQQLDKYLSTKLSTGCAGKQKNRSAAADPTRIGLIS